MGKEVGGIPEAPEVAAAGEADPATSIGTYLRVQREVRGIDLDELQAVTRIPLRSLERLERGEFDRQPDGFARGFVRTVAGALGLDPDEAVARMLAEPEVEPPRRLDPPLRRIAAAAAILVALALVASLAGRLSGGAAPVEESPVVYRQDPVRLLAEEQRGE